MDSEALRTFVAIQRAGGFSAAANLLKRTQPAISRRIAILEAELNAPLFERAAGGVILTQAGEVLLPYAERVLAAVNDATNAVGGLCNGVEGPVSVALVGTLANEHMTHTLKQLKLTSPNIEVSLKTGSSSTVSDLVRRGEVTIGVRYFEDRLADLNHDWISSEKLIIACDPGHSLAGKSIRSLSELKNEHWLAFPLDRERRGGADQNIFNQFAIRDVPCIRWTPIDSLSAQKRLIEAGFGIALLPRTSILEEYDRSISQIFVEDADINIPIVVVTRPGGFLSKAATRLIEFLRDSYSI